MAEYVSLDEKSEQLLAGHLELTDERVHSELRYLINYRIGTDDLESSVRFLAAVLYRLVTRLPHGPSQK